MKGLEKAIGLTVVHPTWEKTRPGDDNDTHCGWVFAEPGQAKANPLGNGSFAFNDITPDPINGATYIRDLYDMVGESG